MTSFLIVDDHPLFRDGLIGILKNLFQDATTIEATTIDSALAAINENDDIELALLDLTMPGVSGFDGFLNIRALAPQLPIAIVSGLEDNRIIQEALSHGAAGFIPKTSSPEELQYAIQNILDGNIHTPDCYEPPAIDHEHTNFTAKLMTLTPQQMRVLRMLRQGLLNKQIAYDLNIGETTVKAHVSEILRKLEVYSRTQAVIEVNKIDFDALMASNEIDE